MATRQASTIIVVLVVVSLIIFNSVHNPTMSSDPSGSSDGSLFPWGHSSSSSSSSSSPKSSSQTSSSSASPASSPKEASSSSSSSSASSPSSLSELLAAKRRSVVRTTMSTVTTKARDVSDEEIQRVIKHCNSDLHNNPKQHRSCLLVRNAAVFPDGSVRFASEDQKETIQEEEQGGAKKSSSTFPSAGVTRYFLKPANLLQVSKSELESSTQESKLTKVGLYQNPVSGAGFDNVWHTLSDFAFTMFDTLVPFFSSSSSSSSYNVEEFGKSLSEKLKFAREKDNSNDDDDEDAKKKKKKKKEKERIFEESRAPLTWLFFPPGTYNFRDRKPCADEETCRSKTLFEVFEKMFHSIHCLSTQHNNKNKQQQQQQQQQKPFRFEWLIIGMSTSCSPVPTEGVGSPRCKTSLRLMRDYLLFQFHFDPLYSSKIHQHRQSHNVLNVGKQQASSSSASVSYFCPRVHLMSRQLDRFRRMHPFDEIEFSLRSVIMKACSLQQKALGNSNNNNNNKREKEPHQFQKQLQTITLTGRMSFHQQLATIVNSDILIAGRGGGTGLSIFLPLGAVYISVSGSDRWNPYRDLVPPWLSSLIHFEAKFVHPSDSRKPCPPTKKGVVNGNKCDYKLDTKALSQLVEGELKTG